jgi:hypothetical protein
VTKRNDVDSMLERHGELVQSDKMRVVSHVQRDQGEWILNTLMLEGYEVPFRYKRKKQYRSLVGARVNLTYYPSTVQVAGMAMETMQVVRIKRS